jgi:hypothetical protein
MHIDCDTFQLSELVKSQVARIWSVKEYQITLSFSCTHPKYQSDSFVANINNKNIKIIFDDYFNNIKKVLNKNFLNVLEHKAWAYLYPKNQENALNWHTHLNENKYEVEVVNVSGLLYITSTNIGT